MTPDADFRGSQRSSPPPRSPGAETALDSQNGQGRHGASGDVPGEPLPVQVRLRPAGQAGPRSLGKLARAVAAPEPRSPASWFAALGTTSCRSRKLKQRTDAVYRLNRCRPRTSPQRRPRQEWGPDDWKWLRVTRGRWGQQSARRQPSGRQCADRAGPGRGDQQSPQNFAAQGPRPSYLQRRRRPRTRTRCSGRGAAPPRRRARTRARLRQRLSSGSARAPPPAPRLQPEEEGGEGPAVPAPAPSGRGRCGGCSCAAASCRRRDPRPGGGAPRAQPRAPPPRALEVPARRSGRSRSHPGPASAGLRPAPRLGTQRPPGTHRESQVGEKEGSPRSPRPAAVGPELQPKESQGPALLRTPPSPWLSYPSAFQGARSYVGLWGCR